MSTNASSENSVPTGLVRRLRYGVEAAGFFLLMGVFRLFDIDQASALGGWIGRNLVSPFMSRRANANLALAFPEKPAAERAAIRRAMWDNLGRVLAEFVHLDEIHETGTNARIELIGKEHIDAAVRRGKGLMFVSGHFANWEVMPTAARDIALSGGTIVRPANNPRVNRWLDRARSRIGLPELIAKGSSGTRRVFALLRKGDAICMLVDQRASEGILVPFFGHKAQTTVAPAMFALKLGSAILPVSNERLGGVRFRIRVHPPIEPEHTGDHDRDAHAMTIAITQFIEDRIRERPGEWLWIHQRWVEDAVLRRRAQTLSPARGGATSATSKRV
jgi:KDO2-lipid IV(A) lauroyltransferase